MNRQAGGRTSLAVDDLVAADPESWAVAAPPGSAARRWVERLTASLEGEADLSAFGRYLARDGLLRGARSFAAWEGARRGRVHRSGVHPGRVVVIAGLPRTGTTLLHMVAGASPDVRVPLGWEYDHPALIGTSDLVARASAVADSAERLRGFARLSPGFDQVHPMEAEGPEECDVLFAHRFESFRMLVLYDIASYRSAWLASDHDACYTWLAAVLEPVVKGNGAVALKAPGHLDGYDALHRHLADPVIVQVYRPVARVLASWVSLVALARGAASNRVQRREALMVEWLDTFGRMVDGGLASRAARPSGWLAVDYDRLVADPDATWAHLADAAGLPPLPAPSAPRGLPRATPRHEYDPSIPAALRVEVADLDERYRALVRG